MEMETVGEGGMWEDERYRERGVGWCMRENGYKKALKHEQLSCAAQKHICVGLYNTRAAQALNRLF